MAATNRREMVKSFLKSPQELFTVLLFAITVGSVIVVTLTAVRLQLDPVYQTIIILVTGFVLALLRATKRVRL